MLSISRHSKHSTASIGIAYTFQLESIRDALDFDEYETLFFLFISFDAKWTAWLKVNIAVDANEIESTDIFDFLDLK